jgi:hypothetical protein
MFQLAGLVAAALAVIVAVAYWSLRGSHDSADLEEHSHEEHGTPGRRPGRTTGTRSGTGGMNQGTRTYRQGDDVAKSRSRFGLGERIGWLRKTDRDAEMWPEESFGGVSDEQFWDDMSSDKPLATTARTAQPETDARRRPAPAPADTRPADVRPVDRTLAQPVQPLPQVKVAQASTQAFPLAAQLATSVQTGPQQALTGPQQVLTGPQPMLTGPQYGRAGSQPVRTGAQPVQAGPLQTGPLQAGPQQVRTAPQAVQGYPPRASVQPQPLAASQPLSAPPAPSFSSASLSPGQPLPSVQPVPAAQPRGRGRHSTGEDPLTSDAFSIRSSTDGRSYQASRRSREITRDQYEAALSQETQTFSLTDADSPSGSYPLRQPDHPRRSRRPEDERGPGSYGTQAGYPAGPVAGSGPVSSPVASSGDGYGGSGAYPYAYGQSAPVSTQTPAQGENYDYDFRDEDPRRPVPARDTSARPPRPVYQGGQRGPYDPRATEYRGSERR